MPNGIPIPLKSGDRFGRWVVLADTHHSQDADGNYVWLCRCDCGTTRTVPAVRLRRGKSNSCGCLRRERQTKHGAAARANGADITYRAWSAMIYRCHNESSPNYPDYGGRGIQVCERWRNSFHAFVADVGRRPSQDYSIDRFPDNNGNYEPGNCRWATHTQQQRNKRSNKLIEYAGEIHCVADWAERVGLPVRCLALRLRKGWDVGRALTTPRTIRDLPNRTPYEHNGECKSLAEWARSAGIKYSTLQERIRAGWDFQRAVTETVSLSPKDHLKR